MTNREIDALVAEKVMGGQVHVVTGWREYTDTRGEVQKAPIIERTHPYYSRDIAAAWQVVEFMRTRSHMNAFALKAPDEDQSPGFWRAIFLKKEVGHEDMADFYLWPTSADTAPMAICKAALKAVGASSPAS